MYVLPVYKYAPDEWNEFGRMRHATREKVRNIREKYLAPRSVTLTNVVAPDFDKCGDISYQRRQTARAKDAERCCDV